MDREFLVSTETLGVHHPSLLSYHPSLKVKDVNHFKKNEKKTVILYSLIKCLKGLATQHIYDFKRDDAYTTAGIVLYHFLVLVKRESVVLCSVVQHNIVKGDLKRSY